MSKGYRVVHGAGGNPYRHHKEGKYMPAPKSGNAAASVAVERVRRLMEKMGITAPLADQLGEHLPQEAPQHQESPTPSAAQHQPQPEHQYVPQAPAPQPARQAAPKLPVPTPVKGIHTLLSYKPEPPAPAMPQDKAERLNDNSAHLQSQTQGYLDNLRSWQARYGGV